MKKIFTLITAVVMGVAALSSCCKKQEETKAKYIFLFIGDGMGTSHIAVTESYLSAKAGKIGGEQLTMTQFPIYGTCTTHCEDKTLPACCSS